jgi:outer membrane lipoprotein carrier protein
MIKRFLAGLACLLVPVAAWSASATVQLRQFVAQVQAATGTFQQARTDTARAAEQSGMFSFRRPGQFRWEVQKPYQQLIVSDGKLVYQYDPDLLQVTRRPVGQSIGASPAAILFGSGSLDQAFALSDRPASEGLDWLRATPKSADAGFAHVDIGFRDGLPVALVLLDAFGQTTRITLSDINTHPSLDASTFQFKAPDGVDIVNMQ